MAIAQITVVGALRGLGFLYRGSERIGTWISKLIVQSSILFCLLLLQNSTPFPKLTVIYEPRGSRTSYLRSLIYPNVSCGCFMVVFVGRPQYKERGLIVP